MERFYLHARNLLAPLVASVPAIWARRGQRSVPMAQGRGIRVDDEQLASTPRTPWIALRRMASVVAVACGLLSTLLYGSGAIAPVFAHDVRQETGATSGGLGNVMIRQDAPTWSRTQSLGLQQDSTTATATVTETVPYTKTPTISEFGLAFVNSAESHSGTQRIQRGWTRGVTTDRFPIYWEQVEKSIGTYTWTSQDTAIKANESLGMDTLAILLGTPRQYRLGGRPCRCRWAGRLLMRLPTRPRVRKAVARRRPGASAL